MGFDPSPLTRVVHVCGPPSLYQYLKEIGRGGPALTASVYYSRRDITSNLHGMSDDTRDYCDVDDFIKKK